MRLTGTVINYYHHCRRQCWLFCNKINLEDNSEDVRIGKVLHELKTDGKSEVAIESIKLDKITNEYVVEMKKSDADINAALAQLEFYLVTLRRKGIDRKGRLECVEKNKQQQKIHFVEVTAERQMELEELYKHAVSLL